MNQIPQMTHPLSRHWSQPDDLREAPMDDTHILLSRRQFKELSEYSATNPSGVYDGKCWKRDDPKRGWLFVWYGDGGPSECTIEHRKIIIGD